MDDPRVQHLMATGRQRGAEALIMVIERRRKRGWFRPLLERLYEQYWVGFVEFWLWRSCRFLWAATLGRWLFLGQRRSRERAQNEIDALRYLARNTTVPVPRVFSCFPWRGQYYILQTRIPGIDLSKAWTSLIESERETIFNQLRFYTSQLRNLQSPYGPRICSTRGKPLSDERLGLNVRHKPMTDLWKFEDEDEMNTALRDLNALEDMPEDVQRSHSVLHPIRYTHGDLQPRNIMVHGTRVTGIIDWETAGWWPAHWEYLKATFNTPDAVTKEFIGYIPRFIPVYKMECDADWYLFDSEYWRPVMC
ncbi:kinase-like protein [Panus rudis PR-1116 ss-1]|nr:kinase-like protein [Panus rudis PR-1116 ss-1]